MCRGMKDSGVQWISIIPESWEVKNIKSLLIERKEINNPIKTEFILSLTKERGVIPYSEKGDVGNKSKEDYTGYKLAYPKDIVLNSMNIIIGSVGISNYFGAVSPVYYMLYPRKEGDYVEYFNYVFQTKEFQNNLKGYGNGIMEHRMRIQMNKLNTVLLPYPPVKQQNKIVNYLDKKVSQIDDIISKQKSLIEKYKAYKQSLITETVTKGLNKNVPMKDSGIEWIGEIPSDWSVTITKNISNKITDGAHVSPETENGVYDFISVVNLDNNFINFNGCLKTSEASYIQMVKNGCKPKKGDVLISKDGTVGKSVVIDYDREFVIASSLVILTPNEKMNSYFLNYVIQSSCIQEQLNSFMKGSGLKRVSVKNNGKLYVTVPSISEQEDIVNFLDKKCSAIDSAISKKEQLIEKLEAYKKSLIYECVTGKREVN